MTINERTYQSAIGVLVIIILFLVWWISTQSGMSGKTGTVATTTEETSSSAVVQETPGTTSGTLVPTTSASGESVSVASQGAGNEVVVSQLNLKQAGWVAVRDSNGRTLGAAWFDVGEHTSVSVPLLRATASGQNYQVLLYADNGDHMFDLHSDVLITNSDGSVAGTTFSVQ